jgi:hypothetical protein
VERSRRVLRLDRRRERAAVERRVLPVSLDLSEFQRNAERLLNTEDELPSSTLVFDL